MKKITDYIGIALISIGVLTLTGLHISGVTFINWLLAIPLLLILTGVVLHVWQQKRKGCY